MRSSNPFVYGEVVTAAAFTDRDEERARLAGDLSEGQKVFLISPRRYGKSSLIRGVMKELAAGGVLTVEVTVAASSCTSPFSSPTRAPCCWPPTPRRAGCAAGRRS